MKMCLRIISAILLIIILASCAGDEKKTAEELNTEAAALFEQNKIDKAIEKAELALRKASDEFGQNNIALIGIIENLTKFYFAKKDFIKTEFLYKKALAIVAATKGEDNMDVAKFMNNLAGLYYVSGKHEQAAALFKQTLAIAEKHLNADDPVLQTLRNNIDRSSTTGASGKPETPNPEFLEMAKTFLDETHSNDQVPQQVKDHAIKGLADNKMIVTDLKPLPPIYMGDKGMVFPYRCNLAAKEGENKKGILLFAAVKSASGEDAVVFQQCRPVSYESYAEALQKGGIEQLRNEIKQIFPDLFSS